MLPDYPEVKRKAEQDLMKWAQKAVPKLEPILANIGRFRQHEGTEWAIHYADEGKEVRGYEEFKSEIELTRQEQRVLSIHRLKEIVATVANDLARQQSKLMMSRIQAEAEDPEGVITGITGEDGPPTKDDFLEAMRNRDFTFNPETGEPEGQFLIVPSEEAAMRMKEWEDDEEFMKERERIMDEKRREWRARENRRKLVD